MESLLRFAEKVARRVSGVTDVVREADKRGAGSAELAAKPTEG